MATSNDIKNGTVLKMDGHLWNVIEFQHVKPGKGGAAWDSAEKLEECMAEVKANTPAQ